MMSRHEAMHRSIEPASSRTIMHSARDGIVERASLTRGSERAIGDVAVVVGLTNLEGDGPRFRGRGTSERQTLLDRDVGGAADDRRDAFLGLERVADRVRH